MAQAVNAPPMETLDWKGQGVTIAQVLDALTEFRHRFARQSLQCRLGIEQVDMRWPAFHEQEDHRFGLGNRIFGIGRRRRGKTISSEQV